MVSLAQRWSLVPDCPVAPKAVRGSWCVVVVPALSSSLDSLGTQRDSLSRMGPLTWPLTTHHSKPWCIEKELSSSERCPVSPSERRLTEPPGRILRCVSEQLNVQSRSHASGGSWSARSAKKRITLPWHTTMSYSCRSTFEGEGEGEGEG